MKKRQDAKIVAYDKDEFTKVTFSPDLAKFKMTELTDDMIGLFMKRAYDIAGTTPGVKDRPQMSHENSWNIHIHIL